MIKLIWTQKYLLQQMVGRELAGRYKGSVIGLAWSFLHPLLMLAVYTFVFGTVFQARWPHSGSTADYALNLFAGMIVFGLFAESISRAPTLILENTNFVKKVVFPLQILSPVILIVSLFHAMASLVVLLIFYIVLHGVPHWSVFWLPVVWAPFMLLLLGGSWFLASLGVYLRDIAQIIGVGVTAMMFLSPIFYPLSALPASVAEWVFLNPLVFVIEQTRAVVLLGHEPDWLAWIQYSGFGLLVFVSGYVWFMKTRKGFADVI